MLIYWILLAIPLLGTLIYADEERAKSTGSLFLMGIFWLFYNGLSALRFNTGGDWYTYSIMVETVRYETLEFTLQRGDQAFSFMIWLSNTLGFGIYGVNTVCSAILSLGVLSVARRLPNPWLALAASVPYLLIVVGLGYIRQGAAIGLVLLSINAFIDRRWLTGGLMILLAMLFHVAAIVVAPLIAIGLGRRDPAILVVVLIASAGVFFYVLTGNRLDTFQRGYVDYAYNSGGAGIRLVQNLVPAFLFVVRAGRIDLDPRERSIWTMFAFACAVCGVAYFLAPGSTAVDRVGLYFSPIQIFAFGYLMRLFADDARWRGLILVAADGYCVAVLYVWLNYATHAQFWVPYRSVFDSVSGL